MFGIKNSWLKAGAAGVAVTMTVAALASPGAFQVAPTKAAKHPAAPSKKLSRDYQRAIAERFTENAGQWNSKAKFLARSKNLDYWVTDQGVVFQYQRSMLRSDGSGAEAGQVIQMAFEGAKAKPSTETRDRRKAVTAFIQPKHVVQGIHSYGELVQHDVYPGVDVRHYFEGERPRYDLLLKPGADASLIKQKFQGASGLSVDAKGNLVLKTKIGDIVEKNLKAFQIVNGSKKNVPVVFKQLSNDEIGFSVGAYDHTKNLVIDPLIYGSYFGGNGGWDEVTAVTSDPDGGVYMTGYTQAPDYPIIFGPFGFNIHGAQAAFVCHFLGDAYNIDYNAYITGSNPDAGLSIIGKFINVDPDDTSIWVAGETTVPDFPLTGSSSTALQPNLQGSQNIFFIQFLKDPQQVLVPHYATYWGNGGETFKGFKIDPSPAGSGSTRGQLVFAGETRSVIPGATASERLGPGWDIYMVRLSPDGMTQVAHKYFGGVDDDFLPVNDYATGMAVDGLGNIVLAGPFHVPGGVNLDTSTPAGQLIFPSTTGVFGQGMPGYNGQLARGDDEWVAKLDNQFNLVYAGILGSSDYDTNYGVDVDVQGNAYVFGYAEAHDFPRTHGTIGEQILEQNVVTKVSADGSTIIYSTGLNDAGGAEGVGIAVDSRGIATVTGSAIADDTWTPSPGPPPNPDVPVGHVNIPTIPTTAGALKTAYTWTGGSGTGNIATYDGWMEVIDPTATTLLYCTFIGGDNNDFIYPPYVDTIGDVWVFGSTDSFQRYVVQPHQTNPPTDISKIQPKDIKSWSPLSASFITALAWKPLPDFPNLPGMSDYSGYESFAAADSYAPWLYSAWQDPADITVYARKDGLVLRFRFSLPVIQSVTVNPSPVPGGFGTTVTGTVTLLAAAPAGGVKVALSVDNASAAVFSDTLTSTSFITIAPGQTSATFTLVTSAVGQTTNVLVKADFQGDFKVTQLVVVPWLQQFAISPNSFDGGITATGLITLFQAAPTGGIQLSISTDSASLVTFPGGTTVTIPAGQTTGTFQIATSGVAAKTNANVTVSLAGVALTAKMTLTPADLLSLTFNPTTVAIGSSTVGTVSLVGTPGSTFTVAVSFVDSSLPAGYSITPSTLTFGPGDTSKSFTVQTGAETGNTTRRIQAHRLAQGNYSDETVVGQINLVLISLTQISVSPNPIAAGGTGTITATISTPALAGGVAVTVSIPASAVTSGQAWFLDSSNHPTNTTTLTIGVGSTSGTATIHGGVLPTTSTVPITATLGAASQTTNLQVQPATLSLTLDPTAVTGGIGSTATIAFTGGVTSTVDTVVSLSSSNPAASLPSTATIKAGDSSVAVAIATSSVTSQQKAQITATSGSASDSKQLTINPISVSSVTVTPSTLFPFHMYTGTVTLSSVAPTGGITVFLSTDTTGAFAELTASVTIPEGQSSATFSLSPNRFSRDILVMVIGATNLSDPTTSASTLVTITRN